MKADMKYTYIANVTNKHGDIVSETSFNSLAEARAKFASVSIAGMLPERLIFDEAFNANDELSVYAEFTQPDFVNYNQMLGFITREEPAHA